MSSRLVSSPIVLQTIPFAQARDLSMNPKELERLRSLARQFAQYSVDIKKSPTDETLKKTFNGLYDALLTSLVEVKDGRYVFKYNMPPDDPLNAQLRDVISIIKDVFGPQLPSSSFRGETVDSTAGSVSKPIYKSDSSLSASAMSEYVPLLSSSSRSSSLHTSVSSSASGSEPFSLGSVSLLSSRDSRPPTEAFSSDRARGVASQPIDFRRTPRIGDGGVSLSVPSFAPPQAMPPPGASAISMASGRPAAAGMPRSRSFSAAEAATMADTGVIPPQIGVPPQSPFAPVQAGAAISPLRPPAKIGIPVGRVRPRPMPRQWRQNASPSPPSSPKPLSRQGSSAGSSYATPTPSSPVSMMSPALSVQSSFSSLAPVRHSYSPVSSHAKLSTEIRTLIDEIIKLHNLNLDKRQEIARLERDRNSQFGDMKGKLELKIKFKQGELEMAKKALDLKETDFNILYQKYAKETEPLKASLALKEAEYNALLQEHATAPFNTHDNSGIVNLNMDMGKITKEVIEKQHKLDKRLSELQAKMIKERANSRTTSTRRQEIEQELNDIEDIRRQTLIIQNGLYQANVPQKSGGIGSFFSGLMRSK